MNEYEKLIQREIKRISRRIENLKEKRSYEGMKNEDLIAALEKELKLLISENESDKLIKIKDVINKYRDKFMIADEAYQKLIELLEELI